MDNVTYIARTNWRNRHQKFGIKQDDRRRHMYLIGATGTGKTTLMLGCAAQDAHSRHQPGFAFLDPMGGAAEELLDYLPTDREVIYFNPGDPEYPLSFNLFERVPRDRRFLVADGIVSVFHNLWGDFWGPRTEDILRSVCLTLLEYPKSTLLSMLRIVNDDAYRGDVLKWVQDPHLLAFWRDEFERYRDAFREEMLSSPRNKVRQFITSPPIRNVLGQVKSKINFSDIIDNRKILVCNLSVGRVGETASNLFGSLIITMLQQAAWQRVDTPPSERADFIVYVDEFQNFTTTAFHTLLSQSRQYHLSLVLANQYLAALDSRRHDQLKPAIFGNVGTLVSFRVGEGDSFELERIFRPEFSALDLQNLGRQQIYLRLMVDGTASRPFSAETLGMNAGLLVGARDAIIARSRRLYCSPRERVERAITNWMSTESNS